MKTQGDGDNLIPKLNKTESRAIEMNMESTIQYFRVDRRQIGFLKFILEACDGIVTMSTVDAGLGLVSLQIPPGCEEEVRGVMMDLQKDIFMEPHKGDS